MAPGASPGQPTNGFGRAFGEMIHPRICLKGARHEHGSSRNIYFALAKGLFETDATNDAGARLKSSVVYAGERFIE